MSEIIEKETDAAALQLSELLSLAHVMADQMGEVSSDYFAGPIDVAQKKDLSPVTEADRLTELAAKKLLQARRPRDLFWGEEFGRSFKAPEEDQITWIIDPIDGTKGFADGLAIWTNLVSVFRGRALLLGMINNPVTGQRFWGGPKLPSRMAWRGLETPLRCSETANLNSLMWRSTTKAYMKGDDRVAFDALSALSAPREGGDAMLYASLASGRTLNVVYDADLAPWDIAAPAGVVLGAGGVLTTGDGKSIDYFREGKTTVLAAASEDLHSAVLDVFSKARNNSALQSSTEVKG